MNVLDSFNLSGRVAVVTGGAGLLGAKHAESIIELGGIPVLVDVDEMGLNETKEKLQSKYNSKVVGRVVDITQVEEIIALRDDLLNKYNRIDILINNAARNPKVGEKGIAGGESSRLENFSVDEWRKDIDVGLTGAFLCSKVIGPQMAQQNNGVILNIASDLGLIAPDQRLYKKEGLGEKEQPVKPVTYSVVKAGLIGLTRYLSTYWADKGVRANTLAPGGVFTNQDKNFLNRLESLIPMGRMADKDEYKAAVAFLVSDASSYMNGATMTIDGGRTVW